MNEHRKHWLIKLENDEVWDRLSPALPQVSPEELALDYFQNRAEINTRLYASPVVVYLIDESHKTHAVLVQHPPEIVELITSPDGDTGRDIMWHGICFDGWMHADDGVTLRGGTTIHGTQPHRFIYGTIKQDAHKTYHVSWYDSDTAFSLTVPKTVDDEDEQERIVVGIAIKKLREVASRYPKYLQMPTLLEPKITCTADNGEVYALSTWEEHNGLHNCCWARIEPPPDFSRVFVRTTLAGLYNEDNRLARTPDGVHLALPPDLTGTEQITEILAAWTKKK